MSFIYDITDTWNNAGTVFNGIKLDVTNTASDTASSILNLGLTDNNRTFRTRIRQTGIFSTLQFDNEEEFEFGLLSSGEPGIGGYGTFLLRLHDKTGNDWPTTSIDANPEEGISLSHGFVSLKLRELFSVSEFQVFDSNNGAGFGFNFSDNQLTFWDQANAEFVGIFTFNDGQLNIPHDVVVDSLNASGSLSAQTILLSAQEAYSLTATTNAVTLPAANKVKLSSTAAYEIRGFELSDITPIYLLNTGSFNITLVHNSASAPSVQRIISTTGANIVLTPGRIVEMTWIDDRWRAWLC